MTGAGTQQDPYIVTTWDELKKLSDDNVEKVYIKFSDNQETSTIDFLGKKCSTIVPTGWHIDGNGWSIRNIDTSSSVFAPEGAAVTYIENLHFVKCKVTDSYFVNDFNLFPGEWKKGLVKWEKCTFSIALVNSTFTNRHYALSESLYSYPMFDCCALSATCEGNSGFSKGEDYPTIKDSSVTMTGANALYCALNNSVIKGNYTAVRVQGVSSIINANIDNLTGSKTSNVIANSDKAQVSSPLIPATTIEINDVAFLDNYGFDVGEEGSKYELDSDDFEQGTIVMNGERDSKTRIRTPAYFSVSGDLSHINVTVDSEKNIQVNIMGYEEVEDSAIVDSTDNEGWLESPATIDLSSYSAAYIRLVLRQSNNNITPSDIRSCEIRTEGSQWRLINGEIVNINTASAPLPPITPVKQDEYIRIFDMRTPQNGFDSNGLAILCPTFCRVTEELNGGWNAILEHPIDDNGKYKYIKEGNLLKIRGQLFTINKVEIGYTGNSGKLTAWAEHIFYQLNDPWIPIGTDIVGTTDPAHAATGQTILAAAMNAMRYNEDEYMVIYSYSYASDLAAAKDDRRVAIYGLYKWLDTKGMTPIEFLMGSDGFISSLGGELYRDNFYFSVDKRMEGSQDNAFVLKADLNITSIQRTVDLSTFCTHFTAITEDGYLWAASWLAETTLGQYPHNIVREKMFDIDMHDVQSISETDLKMMYLTTEGERWFRQQCQPLITYSVNLKDLRKNLDYQDVQMFRFKVGDKGIVDDERLGRKVTLQITRTVTNGLTGEVEQVQFGNTRSFTRNVDYEPISESDLFVPNVIEQACPLRDCDGLRLIDSEGKKILREVTSNG